MSLLQESIIYLLAAVISVPISRRLGFGSVLGYLAAGILIGPFGLRLIQDAEHILHFAEFGVVLLLFIVGLELQPSRLWVMRKMVFGLGPAQVLVTAAFIAIIAILLGLDMTAGIVIGFILALSSTAFVLQLLAEKKQLTTSYGRAAFSILLFQDLAVIPLIAIMPMLGASQQSGGFNLLQIGINVLMIAGLIVGGHYLLRPVLKVAARSEVPEIFTATALLVVIGAAFLMQLANMSMVLGAFIAGMLLADSEYRHQLEVDIAPFKGLLLGLFFIAVGMSVNVGLLLDTPGRILAIVALLMAAKAIVLLPLARSFGLCDWGGATRLAAVMSQGGEFAFVLFAIATRERLLPSTLIDELILAVAVSMLLTPIVYLLVEYTGRRLDTSVEPTYDQPDEQHHDVIIAGFGRVGQIAGRMLRMVDRPFTALEIDSSQVDVVRRYGNIVHFGDASRLELLRAAGGNNAKLFVLAIDDMSASVRTVETVMRHFPHLKIIARARNRRHAHILMDLGVEHIFRETLFSSIALSERMLMSLGHQKDEVQRVASLFRDHDERLLRDQHAIHQSEEKLIQSARDTAAELASLLREDTDQSGPSDV
ncbi:MAG: monovalent cation:proton antiporter-2 (CPA2) family protein [Gammaproteobacteria bacterium]|nr:monovalent cation:proton antiporter-2 (CPA2) family protein [Gammaproteobacteria bacterium]